MLKMACTATVLAQARAPIATEMAITNQTDQIGVLV